MKRSPNIVQKMLSLLTSEERRQVYFLLPIIVAMALLQVVGIASILPFLQLAGDPERLRDKDVLIWLYDRLNFETESGFLFFLGVLAFVTLAFSNAFSAYTTWRIDKFSYMQSHRLSMRLLESYLYRPYVFFLNRNTADLSKRILTEVQQVVSGILMPGLQMIAQSVATIFILAFLIVYNPVLAAAAAVVLGGAYLAIYIRVRRKVARIGKENVIANRFRYQYTHEALHGIKEAKILGKEPSFLAQFAVPSEQAARNSALNHIISAIPRYALEVIAFGGILLIVLYLLAVQQNLGQVLPLIGIFAFASYRLMPALQQIFSTITKARFNMAALDSLYQDAQHEHTKVPGHATKRHDVPPLAFRDKLELRNVAFTYPGASEPVIHGLNLTIEANTSVAFVGATGSGKTTTADIILGLLKPNDGVLIVDGVEVNDENLPNWQRNLGYVPQHIYLSDATIARNIAFGVPEAQMDMAAVERAARIANLHDFVVNDLPNGYKTVVGERGVRLSGGQRQRIGIARALYHDPAVLILDEATSALDGITEESVFQAVEAIAETKTVIMIAHRMSTIRNCDTIYLLDKGCVVSQGSYQELLATNAQFHAMAQGGVRFPSVPAGGR
jgi:ABC-type bacteriocin/lantibiotic exporter with double-glycine peptidase domain